MGSEREFVKRVPFYATFFIAANCDEFEVHHGHALGLQQQISEVLVAATPVDQHANIPIDGLDYAKAHFGLAIVGNAVHVLQAASPRVSRTEPVAATSVGPSTGSSS